MAETETSAVTRTTGPDGVSVRSDAAVEGGSEDEDALFAAKRATARAELIETERVATIKMAQRRREVWLYELKYIDQASGAVRRYSLRFYHADSSIEIVRTTIRPPLGRQLFGRTLPLACQLYGQLVLSLQQIILHCCCAV
jgi:hypothetical protein